MRFERAFTLFEVLAAVALLGILYTTLARVAMEGIRAEGESRRRLEASLLADDILSELEIGFDAGDLPELGTTEREEGDFRVTVKISTYDLPPIPASPQSTRKQRTDAEPKGILAGQENPLRQIEVKVGWLEGEFERQVERTSFAFDFVAVADELEALAGVDGAAGDTAGVPKDIFDQLPSDVQQKLQELNR